MGDVEVVDDVIHGCLNKRRWTRPRCVKVFVASTNTDFMEERRQLLEVVGVDLQSQLESLGIQVEIVDIQYCTKDAYQLADTPDVPVHCNEIGHCFNVSRGCFFLCLVGEKYGRCAIPEKLTDQQYTELCSKCDEEDREILEGYYSCSDGIHSLKLPRELESLDENYETLERILHETGAKSTLEQQLAFALGLSESCRNNIIAITREWDDFDESEDTAEVFHDDRSDEMTALRQYIEHNVPQTNRFTYSVPWRPGGLDADYEDHETYLNEVSEVISARLHELASDHIKQDPEVKARNKNYQEVYNEVVAHLSLLEKMTLGQTHHWEGSEVMEMIRNYTISSYTAGDSSRHTPIIIQGNHLSGKTTLVQLIYEHSPAWFTPARCVRVVRCANQTPRSSYNLELVRVITHQLCYVLNQVFLPKDASFDPLYINNWFQTMLRKFEEANDKVLVILIDDLHRLNPLDSDIVAALSWLPISLPHNVHIICTTQHNMDVLKLTPVQREKFKLPETLIQLPSLSTTQEHVERIEGLLDRIEVKLGKVAMSRLCNLLTCTEFGLCETEMLEVLMPTNDITEVLSLSNGDFTFSTFAVAKVLLAELLLEKQMSGMMLLLWRHAIVRDTARRRYAAAQDVLRAAHAEIANLFFLELTRHEEKKEASESVGEESSAAEEVKETPFQSNLPAADVTYNIRHVEEAWLHLLNAGSHVGLKQLCVCNFDMALACVQTISISYLRSLLEHVRSFILDRDLELVYYTVRKSSQVLTRDTLQLATQLISWLRPVTEDSGDIVSQMITSAMAWCDGYIEPLLVPLNVWLQPPLPLQIKSVHCAGGVRLMEPTPSSQHLVIVPPTGDPQLWHIMTNALVHTFKGHSGPVLCLHVTKGVSYLLTGSEDTSIIVWDLKTFQLKQRIFEHIAPVLSICTALNNSVTVSGGEDSRIIVTSLATGSVVIKIDHHRGPVTSVKVTSTSDVLVSASMDGTICLWSLEGKVTLLNTMHMAASVLLMTLTDDCVFILAWCEDDQLYLRTLATGTELHSLRGLKTKAQCINLAYDNRRAAVGGTDGRVYIFDLHTGLIARTITSHTQCVTGVKVTEKDDFLITAGAAKVTLWSFRQDEEPRKKPNAARNHCGHITCLTVSRDGTLAATGATDSVVNIWQLNSHELQCSLEGHTATVTCVALSANGLFAVSGSEDQTARVWGLTLGNVVSVYMGHQATISTVSVMLDARRVTSRDRNGNIAIWLADDATQMMFIPGAQAGTTALSVSNNMKYVVSSQSTTSLKIWSLVRDEEKWIISHSEEITCFVVTMDNTMVITGSRDQSLKVWQLAGGKLTQVLVGHSDHVTCVAVSVQNRSKVVSGCRDGNLIVWDMVTGADLSTLSHHLGCVTCVQMSADGTLAVSGSEDKSVIVWDVHKGRALSSLMLHVPILGIQMASDASRIAVHLLESCSLTIVCLHNTPAQYVKLPNYCAPSKDVQAPDLRPSSGLKRPMRRLLKKEVSLDTYTWQKKYGHLTCNIMMAAVDERLKRRFSVSASMEEISKIPNASGDQGSQQLGPEQAALAQSQHFDQLEALWNRRSPPRRRLQLSKQNSRQSDPPTPLEEGSGLSD